MGTDRIYATLLALFMALRILRATSIAGKVEIARVESKRNAPVARACLRQLGIPMDGNGERLSFRLSRRETLSITGISRDIPS